MAKIDPLTDLANLQSETTAVTAINGNNTKIEEALANTISRDGSTPNDMDADFDMGLNRVINVGAPVDDNDAVRYVDLVDATGALTPELVELIQDAPGHAQDAADSADAAAQSAVDAANYIGAATSAARWSTGRTITLTGNVTGVSAAWDGSANISFAATIPAGTVSSAMMVAGAAVTNIGYTPAQVAGVVDLADATGFRGAPFRALTGSETLDDDGMGRLLWNTTVGNEIFVPTGLPSGAVYLIVAGNTITVKPNVGVTLTWAGVGSTGNRAISQHGLITLTHVGSNIWYISGSGIS